jgi:hypothetical protein
MQDAQQQLDDAKAQAQASHQEPVSSCLYWLVFSTTGHVGQVLWLPFWSLNEFL